METLDRVIYDAATIAGRVRELGAEISRDYSGHPLLLVGVLRGAFVFLADLARAIPSEVEIDFVGVSSYGDGRRSTGVVTITKDLEASIVGRHVLVVEDIVDTGVTIIDLLAHLRARGPASLEVCALLHKPSPGGTAPHPRYVGFPCPDAFVVGYGMDLAGRWRNLPMIATLRPATGS